MVPVSDSNKNNIVFFVTQSYVIHFKPIQYEREHLFIYMFVDCQLMSIGFNWTYANHRKIFYPKALPKVNKVIEVVNKVIETGEK